MTTPPRAAVVTVSDSCFRGEREDLSGPDACRLLREAGFEQVRQVRTRMPLQIGLLVARVGLASSRHRGV